MINIKLTTSLHCVTLFAVAYTIKNIMRKLLTSLLLLATTIAVAQDKGTIQGKVLDKEMNNESLPFANVFVKGTQSGTTTDMDGVYMFKANPGTYTLVVSFVGYETVEVPNVVVKAGEVTTLDNITLGPNQGVALKEVVIKATTQKESVAALLTDQKKAVEIKTSIGAQELSNLGVSDAASATSKISGVTQSEGSGDVFIRGLGDRYLTTTMNGLPIPSDNIDKKNIDLNLFSTNIIQNIGVTKTFNVENSADQASGNVDIVTKEAKGKNFKLGISSGFNSEAIGVDNFKRTINGDDLTFGFYSRPHTTKDAIFNQSWNTTDGGSPINIGASVALNTKIGDKLRLFFTASHSNNKEYTKGVYRKYRSNVLNNQFTDVENFYVKSNTTALLNLSYPVSDNFKLKINSLFINKSNDRLYEAGRNLKGYVFDQDPKETEAFVRDQNTKLTSLFVNQILGSHNIGEKNKLSWAIGYNIVNADEPNRIRNEVNIFTNDVEFSNVGNYQQRKSNQEIKDNEINAFIKDVITFKDEDEKTTQLKVGLNFRNRQRELVSKFVGVRARNIRTSSIDDLTAAFTSGAITASNLVPDLDANYKGELSVIAPYVSYIFRFNKFGGSLGARYENINLDLPFWSVPNYPGREGNSSSSYNNFAPALNLKYSLTEKSNLRFSFAKTITLPEFKEIAPFEYNDPTGRVTVGNPELKASTNYNFDLKYELFPASGQLISLATFYKTIQDPINAAQSRGSSGNFSYFNTGEQATIFGVELESRVNLLNKDNDPQLNLVFNATRMWHNQDLSKNFQYKGITESGLQGAPDWIVNSSLTYTNKAEKEFLTSLSATYASDKIYSLGSPEDFASSATLYNDEIIENGFLTLDLLVSKKFSERFSAKLTAKNILNPDIKQTQNVKNLNTKVETNETVLSYKKGATISLGINYTF